MSTITVSKEGARYVARFAFNYTIKDLVKDAGFRFDPPNRIWWTSDKALGGALSGSHTALSFTRALNDYREAAHARAQASIEASRAASSNFVVPR